MTGDTDATTAARDMALALLARRAPAATVCPSEIARALGVARSTAAAWRDLMPEVHAAVDRLVADGAVRLSWKGAPLPARTGPYRIGRGNADYKRCPTRRESVSLAACSPASPPSGPPHAGAEKG